MIRNITLLSALICIGLMYCNIETGHSLSSTPPVGHTGAFALGELTCAKSGCHAGNGPQNSGPGNLVINFPGGEYTPGMSYDMSVTINDPGFMQYGFQLIAVADDGLSEGEFISTTSLTTISSDSGRDYISHFNIPDAVGSTFEFTWVAPASNVGTVTFYGVGVSADGSNSPVGDFVYASELAISGQAGDAIGDVNQLQSVSLYPNPVKDHFKLDFDLSDKETVRAELLDMSGKLVQYWDLQDAKPGANSFDLRLDAAYAPGAYVLKLDAGASTHSSSLIIQ